jgi:hypothetical protein
MILNSLASNNITQIIDSIERRANVLQAYIQGSPISSIRIGTAVITNAKFADAAISTGKIEDAAITNAKIVNLSASKATTGTLSADSIEAHTITAGKLNVSTLSSITANLGTITAGSIDGITITSSFFRTSSGDDRIVMYDDQIRFYESGSVRIVMQTGGAYLTGAGIGFFEFGSDGSGTFRGSAGVSSGGTNYIIGSTNVPLILIQALGNGSVELQTANGNIYFSCSTFKINGNTKTAIVPTSQGYNALYCVESPEVWFFDVLDSENNIDPLFMEVTEGEIKSISNSDSQRIIFRKRKKFATMRMERKTKEQYLLNSKLWSN